MIPLGQEEETPPPQAVAGPKVKSRTWTALDQPAAFLARLQHST